MTTGFTTSATLAVTLIGSSLLPSAGAAAGRLAVELDPSHTLTPEDVTYTWVGDALEVSGKVAKAQIRHGRIRGHMDIALLDAQGSVLARHSAALTRHLPNPRDPRQASFDTTIDAVPQDVAVIRVSPSVGHWY
jgi:hypothetical protein